MINTTQDCIDLRDNSVALSLSTCQECGVFRISTKEDKDNFCFDDSAVATKSFTKIRGISNIQASLCFCYLQRI